MSYKRLAVLLCLVVFWADACPPGAGAQEPAAWRPLIFISPQSLARLKELSLNRTAQWRRLYWWAQDPARRQMAAPDGPGLALAALILKETRPEIAKNMGAAAAACALRAAHFGKVEEFSDSRLRIALEPETLPEISRQGYRLLIPNAAQDRAFPIAGWYERGVFVNPAGPSLRTAASKGDTYLLLYDDLQKGAFWGSQVALTLNWAWEHFTSAQREGLAAWLMGQAKAFKDQGRGCFDSDSITALHFTALAGLAVKGLHPQAEELIQQAVETRFKGEILPCLNGAGQGGGWFEGENAGAGAGLKLLEFVAAMNTAGGLDLLSSAPWFGERLTYLIFSILPEVSEGQGGDYRPVCPGGDGLLPAQKAADLHRLQILLLSRLLPREQAAGWARALVFDQKASQVLSEDLFAYEFLWLDPNAPEAPLAAAPLGWLATGTGRAFLRSDWSERGSWLKFSCGPHFAKAQHLDAASLMLYRRGFLMPPSGAFDGPESPHALNYAIRSVAQNAVLIHDQEEYSWYDLRQGFKPRGSYANDGGQRAWATFGPDGRPAETAPWTASGWEKGPAPFSQLGKVYQAGAITSFQQRPRFSYLRGDATPAYRGSTDKAARVVRHVFHLLPGGPQDALAAEAVAVVDDVRLNKETAQVRFVAHFPVRPQIEAATETLGPGRFRAKTDRLRVVVPPSRLDVVCLWPQDGRLWLFGEDDKAACWVDGKNYPPRPPAKNPAPWRAEFGLDAAQGKARPLVHVIFAADQDDPTPPAVTRLSSPDEDTVGIMIADPGWPRVVAVRLGDPGSGRPVAYSFPAGRSRHLVAGLRSDQDYTVHYAPGMIKLTPGPGLRASSAGLLSFIVEPPAGAGDSASALPKEGATPDPDKSQPPRSLP